MSDRDFPIDNGTFTHHEGHEGSCRHFDQSACDCNPDEILKELRENSSEVDSALKRLEDLARQEASGVLPEDGYGKHNSAIIAKLRFMLGYSRILSRNARKVVEKLVAGEVLGQ